MSSLLTHMHSCRSLQCILLVRGGHCVEDWSGNRVFKHVLSVIIMLHYVCILASPMMVVYRFSKVALGLASYILDAWTSILIQVL